MRRLSRAEKLIPQQTGDLKRVRAAAFVRALQGLAPSQRWAVEVRRLGTGFIIVMADQDALHDEDGRR